MSTRLAWAAGFFDGEGCVYVSGYTRGRNKLAITQKDRTILEYFESIIALDGKIYPAGKDNKYWVLHYSGIKGLALGNLLLPYMHHPDKIKKFAEYQKDFA